MMKKLTILIVIVFASLTMTANTPKTNYVTQVRAKIVKLLENVPFIIDASVDAQVEFLITKNGEIVVISVNSKNDLVENYVKSKLNYKKVIIADNSFPHFYKMPLKIVKKD